MSFVHNGALALGSDVPMRRRRQTNSQTDVTVMFSKDNVIVTSNPVQSRRSILFQGVLENPNGCLFSGREQEQVSSDQASCDDHSTADPMPRSIDVA